MRDEASPNTPAQDDRPLTKGRARFPLIVRSRPKLVFLVLAGLICVFLLPVLALVTPPGQRTIETVIEAPLLDQLIASVPEPFQLTVDRLDTRVAPTALRVELIGARLSGPGLSVDLDQVTVRVRYADFLAGQLVPGRIDIGGALVMVDDLTAVPDLAGFAGFSAGAFDSPIVTGINEFQPIADTSSSQTADAQSVETGPGLPASDDDLTAVAPLPASGRLDAVLTALDTFDRLLTTLTVDEAWQGLDTITLDRLTLVPQPDSAVPFRRNPDAFGVILTRLGPRELDLRVTGLDRREPIMLSVRHAESGVPEGPALLSDVAGSGLREGQAFSHVLMNGLATDDITDAFSSDGPIAFSSNLAAELVITRDDASGEIDQVVALFESDAGYLIASGKHATILEFAALPMIYSRRTGRFDIVEALLDFPDTGGVFNGHLAPTLKNGEIGLELVLQAEDYRLSVPAEPRLGRTEQPVEARVQLELFVPDAGQRADLTLAQIDVGRVAGAFSGSIEQTDEGTLVALVGQTTPMRAAHLAAMWPLPVSPNARSWFLAHIADAELATGELSFGANLDRIEVRDGRTFMSDGMLAINVPYQNLVLRTPGDLPAVFGLDGTLQVTGRTLRMQGENGVGRLDEGDQIVVQSANFFIPDHAQPDPFAAIELQMDGPAAGFIRLASLDPVNLGDDIPFNARAIEGQADVYARLEAFLTDPIDRNTLRASMDARVTGFASSEPVEGRSLSDGTFVLRSRDDAIIVSGEARLDGVLTELNLSTADETGLQLSMQLDADDRRRMGLDLNPFLTGTIGVDAGPPDEDGTRTMAVDLTDAALTIAELGFSKPAGIAARASFDVVERGDQWDVRNLVVASEGLSARGNLSFMGDELRVAEFETLAIDGVGRFSLDLTRNGANTVARLRGDRFVLTPDLLRGDRDAAGTLALQMEVGELVTQDGTRLADMRLTYRQDAGRIEGFDLRARHSDGTELAGTLAPNGDGSLIISSGNAGTFLRFLGLYDRAQGGRATLVLDPGSVGGRLVGQLLLSDYQIVGEPAMDRIFTSGRDSAQQNAASIVLPGEFETADRIDVEVTNITFDRTPERLIIRRAEGWGPSLGGNLEGVIDYAAGQMRLSGTYVPFFTINNIFSRIPIIGQALGGRESEGLLGITFELAGPVDAPQLRVNPMSILAPGVFRNIFEYQQGG